MPRTKKILIIDDERDFCELVGLLLKSQPYQVDCAYNLRDASQLLKKEHPAIVLLDHNLPDGTGLDFFNARKAEFDEAKIILISADPSPDLRKRAEEAGLGFLSKPFGLKKIRDILYACA